MKYAVLLWLSAMQFASAAEISALKLAESMQQARYSDGFQARMNIAVIQADGARSMPFRIAVIGQYSEHRQRLLIRVIAAGLPRVVAAERDREGNIRAFEYRAPDSEATPVDPYARLFGSGLTVWDLFGGWWSWPTQERAGTDSVAGRECVLLRSQNATSKIRTVQSCVDQEAKLSLRTQMYQHGRTLLRSVVVERMLRKESGAMAAKNLYILEADRTLTELDVYSGDEHYSIEPDTFARLDALASGAQ